jgi:hypothetical protein
MIEQSYKVVAERLQDVGSGIAADICHVAYGDYTDEQHQSLIGPVLAVIFEIPEAYDAFLELIGDEDPDKADQRSVRGHSGKDVAENAVAVFRIDVNNIEFPADHWFDQSDLARYERTD